MTPQDTSGYRTERTRAVACLAIGLVGAAIAAATRIWALAVLAGWTCAAGAFLVWVWVEVAGLDPAQTAAVATRADNSRNVARTVTLAASVASLIGVLFGLARAANESTGTRATLIVAALLTVVSAWGVVHCVYMLRYAHLYYSGTVGGVDFPGDGEPSYHDFAYLAFTVGMTFQVADTDITGSDVRRTLLVHALLSYLFGAAIVAVTINVVAGLV